MVNNKKPRTCQSPRHDGLQGLLYARRLARIWHQVSSSCSDALNKSTSLAQITFVTLCNTISPVLRCSKPPKGSHCMHLGEHDC